MTKLTTERLETIATWRETYGNGANVMIPAEEAELMARQLLAYERAAKNPIGSFHISGGQVEATTDYCRDGEWPVQDGEVLVYAAPVLPKQPELIGMKVSIDTGYDNIGHRLFGEIVGTSESNGVPVLCIEVTENNVDVAAPAQPVIPEQPDSQDLELYVDMLENSDSDDEDGELNNTQLIVWLKELQRRRALSAQPVSEPYKLSHDWGEGQFAYQNIFNAIAAVVSKHPNIQISIKALDNSMLAAEQEHE